MKRILALDTTSEYGSLALVEDGEVLSEVPLYAPEGYSQTLFPEIERLLGRFDWHFHDLSGYAAASGPGSFTGARIGLAAIKGLADTTGLPCAGISTLEALASYGSAALRAPFFDARRGEIYAGLYDVQLKRLADEVVIPFPAWRAALMPEAELLTWDPAVFGVEATRVPRALAGTIGRLSAGRLRPAVELDANYVRRSDAELKWTER
jgi:tRNA threonylcarbamoyladenosine biosynthesis protein TsaB